MGDLGGQKGWRLGIIRLTAGDPAPTVSAVCVVSEVRAARQGVRVFRMMALTVDEGMRGQGLASGAIARMQAYLLLEAGPRFEMRADMATCMTEDGAGFYASQGWTGGEGVWSWRSEATEVEGALRLLASGEALEQLLQECEQDMDAADEAVSDLQGAGLQSGKRKREEELDDQPVRHSLWEQGSLEAYNELLFGYLDGEVEALQQRKAEYDEERRLSEGSDSCWSGANSDSDSAAEIEAGTEPIALEGAVVAVIQGGEGEGAAGERAGKRKRRHKLAQQPVRHSLWEQDSLEALNEVLAGCLEGEVRALKQRKADYDEERRQSGSDSCWSGADSDSDSAAELEVIDEPSVLEGAAG